MGKKIVRCETVMQPVGPYSLAVRSKGLLFVSGTAGWDRDGRVPPDFREEARLMYENLKAVVEAEGASLADVVSTTTYLVRASDYPALNEVRRGYFSKDPPASAVVGVKELMRPDLTVEVEAVAELPAGRRRAAAGGHSRAVKRGRSAARRR
jgi:2-iminobutanoate/2-iminopropanoate deaminase